MQTDVRTDNVVRRGHTQFYRCDGIKGGRIEGWLGFRNAALPIEKSIFLIFMKKINSSKLSNHEIF